VVVAILANVEVLLELENVDQGAAVRALDPQALGHVFTSIEAAEAGFAENTHGS
jgi:hypothetical protein